MASNVDTKDGNDNITEQIRGKLTFVATDKHIKKPQILF